MQEYLQNVCDELCQKYGIAHHEVIIDNSLMIIKNNVAEYHLRDKEILLREESGVEEKEEAVYHEFRHAWQAVSYFKMYAWWLNRKRRETYIKFYGTLLNSIEADALTFGQSRGDHGREDCLNFFSVSDLDELEQQGTLNFALEIMEKELPGVLWN